MIENRRNLRIWSSSPPHIRLHIGILPLRRWKFSAGVAAQLPQAKQECNEKRPPFRLSVAGTRAWLAMPFPGFSTSFFRVQVHNSLPHPKTRSSERIGESSQFTGKSDASTELERHGHATERPHSHIPSIFEHTSRNSSTIKSNYQLPPPTDREVVNGVNVRRNQPQSSNVGLKVGNKAEPPCSYCSQHGRC